MNRFGLILVVSLLFTGKLLACSCVGTPTVAEAFERSAAVFSGKVIGTDTLTRKSSSGHAYHQRDFLLVVETSYKGVKVQDTVRIYTGFGGGDCGYAFNVGQTYLVYAYTIGRGEDTGLGVNICTRTRPWNAEEAAALANPLPPGNEEVPDVVPEKAPVPEATPEQILELLNTPTDSTGHFITVHYLHGSKPARGHKATETHYFGGIHGGHVYLQLDDIIFSFVPAHCDDTGPFPVHAFAHKHKRCSAYDSETPEQFAMDTVGAQVTSITYSISDSQFVVLNTLRQEYITQTPYDYAFFGMRCAAAAYEVLGHAGLVKKKGNFTIVCRNFYPQRMRKRMLKYAKKHDLQVTRKKGRPSRKWEKD